jgi:hypothetical protein
VDGVTGIEDTTFVFDEAYEIKEVKQATEILGLNTTVSQFVARQDTTQLVEMHQVLVKVNQVLKQMESHC